MVLQASIAQGLLFEYTNGYGNCWKMQGVRSIDVRLTP
ncbi:hypothetical protein JCM19239_3331 [Vibrio variabilis]|uniref:Uncharacterized protein n=1 Tax=Vibrio variabilis TaxID=990271 RepID=A0ABQ0JH53_9VIBR|nr:hypothetical protein JCM19239_3331 [Vibrio variabilis]